MRDRNCYICKKDLNWTEYLEINPHLSIDYLKKIWKHKYIQILCCDCFREVGLQSKHISHSQRLVKSQKKIAKIIE